MSIANNKIKMDKFGIIHNDVINLSNDKIGSIFDNYIENIFHSNEKTVLSDLLTQIIWFNKDFDPSNIIGKHLDNFLREKKMTVRNNIKRCNFSIDNLNNLIDNYYERMNQFSAFSKDKNNNTKIAISKLYTQIISEPSLISFLKLELSTLDENNKNNISKFIKTMKNISDLNPELKCYQWCLVLISSVLAESTQELIDKSYPVPEKQQKIINFRDSLSFYEKVKKYYDFIKPEFDIIFNDMFNLILTKLFDVMKICTPYEFYNLFDSNSNTLFTIFSNEIITYDGITLKDAFTFNFYLFFERFEKDLSTEIGNIIRCTVETTGLLSKGINKNLGEKILSTIFSNDKAIDYILENIHHGILNTQSTTNLITRHFYQNLFYCVDIKNKDKFINKYNQLLIQRLLYKPNIDIERECALIIKKFLGAKITSNTMKIISDMMLTLTDRKSFMELKNLQPDKKIDRLNVITTSYNSWDINQNEGILTTEMVKHHSKRSELFSLLSIYKDFYCSKHGNNRKLNWYPHFGEIEFVYKKINFVMLPIQFMILEAFDQFKTIQCDNVLKFNFLSNYSEHFKKTIISSMIYGGILKNSDNTISLNNQPDNVSTNYVDIFFGTSDYSDIWNKRRDVELTMDRKDILSTQVNHFVKKNPETLDELFMKISQSNNLFEFDKALLTEVVDNMISKDYIKYNTDNKLEKVYW